MAKNELVKASDLQDKLEKFENPLDVLAAFENVNDADLADLTSEYFNFEEKGTYNFVFTGLTTMDKDGKEIECVSLTDKSGKKYINGNAVLVNSLKRVTSLPCLVRVTYKGEVKGDRGNYKDLDVKTVPSAKS